MKIYGALLSPFVRKVLVIADLKGLEYEHVNVIPGATPPGYEKISPLKKIPALEDGDLSLCDSTVICEYLEDQYPEIAAFPTDPKLKARARWLEEYADSKLAELLGGIFFERLAKPMIMQQPTDEARVANIVEELLPPQLDYLEQLLPARGFVFDDFGIADISLASPFVNAAYGNFQLDEARWPTVAAYIGRVRSEPAVAAILVAEAEMMAAMAG